MKTIKINFCDFWSDLDKEDNFITNALRTNFNVEISDDPDYLFCSSFGYSHLKYDCVKIFYTGENLCPDFNLFDYAFGGQDIEFGDRFLRFPFYVVYGYGFEPALKKHLKDDEYYLTRSGFCNYVISNSISDGKRDRMIDILSKYKKTDGGGKYRNTIGKCVEDKIAFEENYKFTLCFENSSSYGYTTEKLPEAFAGGGIPIYYGNPDVSKEFNSKAFINCHDFDSFEDVLERIKQIDNDDELYLSYVKQPMFDETSTGLKYSDEKRLDDYFYKIFSQDYEKTFRRNMNYIGYRYQRHMRAVYFTDKFMNFPRRVAYYLHNRYKIYKTKNKPDNG